MLRRVVKLQDLRTLQEATVASYAVFSSIFVTLSAVKSFEFASLLCVVQCKCFAWTSTRLHSGIYCAQHGVTQPLSHWMREGGDDCAYFRSYSGIHAFTPIRTEFVYREAKTAGFKGQVHAWK
ncbi:hypothetical protein KC357_g236 [Hortaea werneckii]|nr:hypothetical protein KC357_g236 [Hortaea werneckii]